MNGADGIVFPTLSFIVCSSRTRRECACVLDLLEWPAHRIAVRLDGPGLRIRHGDVDRHVRESGCEKPVARRGPGAGVQSLYHQLDVIGTEEPEVAAVVGERNCLTRPAASSRSA